MYQHLLQLLIRAKQEGRPLVVLLSTSVPGWPAWHRTTLLSVDTVGVIVVSPKGEKTMLPWRAVNAVAELR